MSSKTPANPINQTDFANKLGIKRQAINGAIKAGKLVKHGKGRAAYIDLNCPLTIVYMKSPANQRHVGKTTKPPAPPVPLASGKKGKEIPPDLPDNNEAVEAFIANQAIKDLKLQEDYEKVKLNNRKTRGELVERTLVQAFAHREHEIDNSQWKPLGLKVSSDVAAAFGIDDDEKVRKACGIIDREVLAILKQIKREQNKFLKQIGAEKLPKEERAA